MRSRRRINVEYRRLRGIYGDASDAALDNGKTPVLVDSRIKGKKRLEIIIHEAYHVLNPEAPEEIVEKIGVVLANTLWHEGYRQIDNSNDIPLQDGKL